MKKNPHHLNKKDSSVTNAFNNAIFSNHQYEFLIKIFVFSLIFLFFGITTYAQGNTLQYQLLEPIQGFTRNTFTPGDFSSLLNNFFRLGIWVASILAIIMVAAGGIQYMASDVVTNKEDAKKKIRGAIGGLLLALGIYLFLYTIYPGLVNLKLDVMAPRTSPIATAPPPGGTRDSTMAPKTPSPKETLEDSRLKDVLADESRVRAELSRIGVKVTGTRTSNPCQKVNESGCTLVGTLPPQAIARLSTIKLFCKCDLTITAGTEWWGHITHGPYKAIVDLRKNPALDSFIKNRKPVRTSQGSRGTWYLTDLGRFLDEGTHWHAEF